MSSDEYMDGDANTDAWNAQFFDDPTSTTLNLVEAALAARDAQEYRTHDAQQVAANAAAMLAQAQAQHAEQAAGAELAQAVDRSMAHQYGAEYAKHAPTVGRRLADDPGFAAINQSDPNAVLQYIDQTYQQVVAERDPGVQEWARIKQAGQKEYWRSAEYRQALDEVQRRG